MVVEALAGALSGAGTSRPDATRGGNALFVMAIDVSSFRPLEGFAASFAGLVDYVKTPPFREGVDEVLVAGEPERRQMAERLAHGIPLDEETWRQLCAAAVSVGCEALEV
jgi:hydroxycarboxylate dehydrogenase B